MAILILDKIDFKSETITRDRKRHYVLIKESVYHYMCTNQWSPKMYDANIDQMKEKIDHSTTIDEHFSITLNNE